MQRQFEKTRIRANPSAKPSLTLGMHKAEPWLAGRFRPEPMSKLTPSNTSCLYESRYIRGIYFAEDYELLVEILISERRPLLALFGHPTCIEECLLSG